MAAGLFIWLGVFLSAVPPTAQAGPVVSTDSAIGFFTNVASRLLKTQSTLELNRIQIYPTNQYTPSIHRLLQVTANVYDCMTNRPVTDYPYVPSVFRPLFTNDNGIIYICGYAEETGTNLLGVTLRDMSDPADRAALQGNDMVWGVPAIVGVKKGYPSFNKFAQQMLVQVTRKLQFRRHSDNTSPIVQTNQMYLLGITNSFGVDAWNPYSTSFPRDLRIIALPQISVVVTNELGTVLVNLQNQPAVTTVDIPSNTWSGYNVVSPHNSFRVPLSPTNFVRLTNSIYSHSLDAFVSNTNDYETAFPTFWVPHWWLNLKSRVRFAVLDTAANRIVDYVNLSDDDGVNLSDLLFTGGQCGNSFVADSGSGSHWCTNRFSPTDANLPTFGILNQILTSEGSLPVNPNTVINDFGDWSKVSAINFFRWQFNLGPIASSPPGPFYLTNTFVAPFQPYRQIYLATLWQANDPLVHYTVSDLKDLINADVQMDYLSFPPVSALGTTSDSCQPWSHWRVSLRNPIGAADSTVKDPLVKSSDLWNFPTNIQADLRGLGQVHRGTPWQTLYLRSGGVSLSNWMKWTGNNIVITNNGQIPTHTLSPNGLSYDALFTMPTNDWRIASLLVSLLSNDAPATRSSPNPSDSSAWLSLLHGMTVFTNTLADEEVYGAPQFTAETMTSNSPQASIIAEAIEALRNTQPGRRFVSPGDILAVPELSMASPWLHLSSDQQQYGINDHAYEAIPSQILPLLRSDSIGVAGQTGDGLHIQFSGEEGGRYGVQMSSNLVDWNFVSTNSPFNGVFDFVDAAASGASHRYYRSVLLP